MHLLIGIPFWQWDDKELELQADMDRFVEDGSLDDNVESFLSHDDTDPRDPVGRCMDGSKGAVNAIPCHLILLVSLQLPASKCIAFESGKYLMFSILPQSYLLNLCSMCL